MASLVSGHRCVHWLLVCFVGARLSKYMHLNKWCCVVCVNGHEISMLALSHRIRFLCLAHYSHISIEPRLHGGSRFSAKSESSDKP